MSQGLRGGNDPEQFEVLVPVCDPVVPLISLTEG